MTGKCWITEGFDYVAMNIYEGLLMEIYKINHFWKIIYRASPDSQELYQYPNISVSVIVYHLSV